MLSHHKQALDRQYTASDQRSDSSRLAPFCWLLSSQCLCARFETGRADFSAPHFKLFTEELQRGRCRHLVKRSAAPKVVGRVKDQCSYHLAWCLTKDSRFYQWKKASKPPSSASRSLVPMVGTLQTWTIGTCHFARIKSASRNAYLSIPLTERGVCWTSMDNHKPQHPSISQGPGLYYFRDAFFSSALQQKWF